MILHVPQQTPAVEHSRIYRGKRQISSVSPSDYLFARKTWRGPQTDRRFIIPEIHENIGHGHQDSRSRFLQKASRILPQMVAEHRSKQPKFKAIGKANRWADLGSPERPCLPWHHHCFRFFPPECHPQTTSQPQDLLSTLCFPNRRAGYVIKSHTHTISAAEDEHRCERPRCHATGGGRHSLRALK
jgi:hypothetical protein